MASYWPALSCPLAQQPCLEFLLLTHRVTPPVEGKGYRQKIILYGGEAAGACLNRQKEALGPLACLLSTVALCQLSPLWTLGPSWPKAAWDCDPVHTGVIVVRLSVMVMVMLMVMMVR